MPGKDSLAEQREGAACKRPALGASFRTCRSRFVLVEWLELTSTAPDPECGWLKYFKND